MILVLACVGLSVHLASAQEKKELYVLTTGDVHGAWFNRSYIDNRTNTSLMSVMAYVQELRDSVGKENVLLLDAGDSMQGDNAAYYFNYVDTDRESFFVSIMDYMGYDALAVGNHDVETGHPVYDKVYKELSAKGIPFLAANALRTDNGEPYFSSYKCFERAGLKVAVLGYTNANMKAWLSPEIWEGMDFESILSVAQTHVDEILQKEKPDVLILLTHTGTGEGNGEVLESEGLDLLNALNGVDLIVTAHDHSPVAISREDRALVNAGNRGRNITKTVIEVSKEDDDVVEKHIYPSVLNLDRNEIDEAMLSHFESEYQQVKAFSNAEIGSLPMQLRSNDAFAGMSDYINLTHTVMLSPKEAQISFSAPLKTNGVVKAGTVIYNDLFTIYPFENSLYVIKMSGKEIKDYLEYSYNIWIQQDKEHVLNISPREDKRNDTQSWSFNYASFNFDSAAGLNYTVDIRKPYGKRVKITSLADGSKFDEDKVYNVSMTSYRFNGGGDLIVEGAGIDKDELESRVVAVYPAIRDMIREMFIEYGELSEDVISNKKILGEWKFIPEKKAGKMIQQDLDLLFRR